MNILIVISNLEMGGAQRVSINLARWINENTDHNATIVALSHLPNSEYDMTGCNYHFLKSTNKVFELRRFIQSQKIHIVLTMGVPLSIYTIPATIGLKVKNIVSERNDPTHFSGKKITAFVSRNFMKMADGYIFQTEQAQAFYGRKIVENSTIIPNPLFDVNKMPSKQFSGVREKVITTVGRLVPQKNHKLLIDSFAEIKQRYPDFKLVIWGEGVNRSWLESYINKLNLEESVFLPGTTGEVFDKIYKSSLFVLSSDFEGMPNALIEAMALGLPIISTDCPIGGPSYLIRGKNNGLLVNVGDRKSLVEAMDYILSNPDKSELLGKEAFKIREELSVDNINQKWLDYFYKINLK